MASLAVARRRFHTRAINAALKAPDTDMEACAKRTMRGLWRRYRDVAVIAEELGTSIRSVQRYLVASGIRERDDSRVNKRYRRKPSSRVR